MSTCSDCSFIRSLSAALRESVKWNDSQTHTEIFVWLLLNADQLFLLFQTFNRFSCVIIYAVLALTHTHISSRSNQVLWVFIRFTGLFDIEAVIVGPGWRATLWTQKYSVLCVIITLCCDTETWLRLCESKITAAI